MSKPISKKSEEDQPIQFTCKLSKSLVKRLKKQAVEWEINVKNIVNAAIEEYLNKREGRNV